MPQDPPADSKTLARPRALPRPPPDGAVERSARAWSPALQAGPAACKEEEIFDKIDRTVELLGPSQSHTGLQLASACLNPMMDYLGRGMDANAYTLPFFTRFDAKMANAIAKLIGQGEEWPADGTAHLGRDAWELAR